MSKSRIYWTLQIVGWSALMLYEFIIYTAQFGFDLEYLLLSFANILMAIGLTHTYRLIVRRWNWSSLPLIKLAFRVLVSVLILGTIMSFINIPLDREIIGSNLDFNAFVFWNYISSWSKNMLTWVLAYTVYHYVEHTRLTELEKIMLKTSMREAEAKVLRSQLNPHFTFNALNSIRALVYEDPGKAQQSITQLSNILRNSLLADRRKTVELREELKTVEDYLELEKVRYEARLSYTISPDPQTLYWQVPPMMLQTLVENGIKHGISKLPGGGTLSVETHLKEEALLINIRNSGTLGDTDSGGVGLLNTAERLSILYGKEAYFKIMQEDDSTVCSEIKIPILSDGLYRFNGDASNKLEATKT